MEKRNLKPITNKLLWIFAIGQLGWSILSGIVVNWLVYFYQPSQEGLESGLSVFVPQGAIFLGMTVMGIIAAIGRIFDAVTDPFIASKSDRSKHKDGRRIPFMRAVAIPFGLITVLVFFSPISGESTLNSVFLLVMCLLFYLAMTIYCTPYNALIPELGKTPKDRINLSTYISVTYFFGSAVAYLVPNIAGILAGSMPYITAFRVTIAILALIAVIFMLIPSLLIKEKDYIDTKPSDTPAFKSLIKTFKNDEFRKFVGSDVLYWIALTIFQTGLPFYVTSLMKLDAGMNFILFALMTVFSLIFYAPVNIIAKKIGKKRLVVGAFFFFACVFGITTFAGMFGIGSMVWGVGIAFLASIPMAVLGILPQAILADIADYDAEKAGENRQGMFFAARTFAFKLGQSIAMLIFTAVAVIGENGYGYRLSAVIATIFCFLGGIVLLRYNEDKILGSMKDKLKK